MGLFMSGDGLERVDDKQLEDVAGGDIHYAGGCFDNTSKYEVIHDETGEVLATFGGLTPDAYAKAKAKAIELGMSTDTISDNNLAALRYWYKQGKK